MARIHRSVRSALAGVCVAALAGPAFAASVRVPMAFATADGPGAAAGAVTLSDSAAGVVFALDLRDLPPGSHGFHVHEKPSCAPATGADGKLTPAGAAGAHLDPEKTGAHLGPHGKGHLGDLPKIEVGADGAAKASLVAHRIKSVSELRGRALMIHAGGDTYSDSPPLGGGGARLICGVVPS